jgi:hypothetical protein
MSAEVVQFVKPCKKLTIKYPAIFYTSRTDENIKAAMLEWGAQLNNEVLNLTDRTLEYLVPVEWVEKIAGHLAMVNLPYTVEAA